MQFVSATKQFKSTLIDKHAGSVKKKINKFIIDFKYSNEYQAFFYLHNL